MYIVKDPIYFEIKIKKTGLFKYTIQTTYLDENKDMYAYGIETVYGKKNAQITLDNNFIWAMYKRYVEYNNITFIDCTDKSFKKYKI